METNKKKQLLLFTAGLLLILSIAAVMTIFLPLKAVSGTEPIWDKYPDGSNLDVCTRLTLDGNEINIGDDIDVLKKAGIKTETETGAESSVVYYYPNGKSLSGASDDRLEPFVSFVTDSKNRITQFGIVTYGEELDCNWSIGGFISSDEHDRQDFLKAFGKQDVSEESSLWWTSGEKRKMDENGKVIERETIPPQITADFYGEKLIAMYYSNKAAFTADKYMMKRFGSVFLIQDFRYSGATGPFTNTEITDIRHSLSDIEGRTTVYRFIPMGDQMDTFNSLYNTAAIAPYSMLTARPDGEIEILLNEYEKQTFRGYYSGRLSTLVDDYETQLNENAEEDNLPKVQVDIALDWSTDDNILRVQLGNGAKQEHVSAVLRLAAERFYCCNLFQDFRVEITDAGWHEGETPLWACDDFATHLHEGTVPELPNV